MQHVDIKFQINAYSQVNVYWPLPDLAIHRVSENVSSVMSVFNICHPSDDFLTHFFLRVHHHWFAFLSIWFAPYLFHVSVLDLEEQPLSFASTRLNQLVSNSEMLHAGLWLFGIYMASRTVFKDTTIPSLPETSWAILIMDLLLRHTNSHSHIWTYTLNIF